MYGIQIVSRLSGVSVHTIRTWEKRYHCVAPKRQKNGRRIYDDLAVQKLQLLNEACKLGESIGNIAQMSISDLESLLKKLGGHLSSKNKIEKIEVNSSESLNQLISALKNFQLGIISHELYKLKMLLPPKEYVLEIISPLLQAIGSEVANKRLSISQEHAISSIIKFQLGQSIYQDYEKKYRSKVKIALATPEGEHHEFGILLSAIIISQYGIPYYYLGSNLPAHSFKEAAKALDIDILILGTTPSINNNRDGFLDNYISNLLADISLKQQVWIGGNGAFNLKKFQKNPKFHYISTLNHLINYLDSI